MTFGTINFDPKCRPGEGTMMRRAGLALLLCVGVALIATFSIHHQPSVELAAVSVGVPYPPHCPEWDRSLFLSLASGRKMLP